jgi:DNA replication protein DnaC
MAIQDDLRDLKLHYLTNHLDIFIQERCANKDGPLETISKMASLELIDRKSRATQYRLDKAKIGKMKSMVDFDWGWPKNLKKYEIEEFLSCEFIKDKRNLLLIGPQGVGKTMIAKNIAWNSALQGSSVLFTTASNMAIDLGSQESTAALQRRLKLYTSPQLLVIDELGYLAFEPKSADLIFDVISRRYESGSIILTTNLAFRDWGSIFPGAACVTAMIDRIVHHTSIIQIDAQSYRARREASSVIKSDPSQNQEDPSILKGKSKK